MQIRQSLYFLPPDGARSGTNICIYRTCLLLTCYRYRIQSIGTGYKVLDIGYRVQDFLLRERIVK